MKALVLSLPAIALLVGTAQAYDYVDSKGYRHWNHYAERKGSQREVVQNENRPKVEIIQDTVKFRPIDEAEAEPSE